MLDFDKISEYIDKATLMKTRMGEKSGSSPGGIKSRTDIQKILTIGVS
jgi:hypothetical protein